jgi:hypothetical protein
LRKESKQKILTKYTEVDILKCEISQQYFFLAAKRKHTGLKKQGPDFFNSIQFILFCSGNPY